MNFNRIDVYLKLFFVSSWKILIYQQQQQKNIRNHHIIMQPVPIRHTNIDSSDVRQRFACLLEITNSGAIIVSDTFDAHLPNGSL